MNQDAPKPPKPYMVALLFGDQPKQMVFACGVIAPEPAVATAMATSLIVQHYKLEVPLQGINLLEMEEQFLVGALAALRGDTTAGNKVVALRAIETPPAPPLPSQSPPDGA